MTAFSITIGAAECDVLEAQLRAYLHWIAERYGEMPNRKHWNYNSAEDLILKTGIAWHANIWDMDVADMRSGECFRNCFIVSQRNPRFRYVEGWAVMEYGFPCHHAWLIDENGHVQDPTWKPLYRRQMERSKAKGSTQPWNGRAAYLGVFAPSHDLHDEWVAAREYPNLLSINDYDIEAVMLLGVTEALERITT